MLKNIEAYIFASRFGIAVYERQATDVPNANVALEVGYFLGMGKPVCLLKDRSMPMLHSDLVGRLYVPFNVDDISESIPKAIAGWLTSRNLS